MTDLAAAITLEAEGMRKRRATKRTKERKRSDAAFRRRSDYSVRKARERGKQWTSKAVKNHAYDDMSLHLCASVRLRLYELENAEWEAKHGGKI